MLKAILRWLWPPEPQPIHRLYPRFVQDEEVWVELSRLRQRVSALEAASAYEKSRQD